MFLDFIFVFHSSVQYCIFCKLHRKVYAQFSPPWYWRPSCANPFEIYCSVKGVSLLFVMHLTFSSFYRREKKIMYQDMNKRLKCLSRDWNNWWFFLSIYKSNHEAFIFNHKEYTLCCVWGTQVCGNCVRSIGWGVAMSTSYLVRNITKTRRQKSRHFLPVLYSTIWHMILYGIPLQ